MKFMTKIIKTMAAMAIFSTALTFGCSNGNNNMQDEDGTTVSESAGEHSREGNGTKEGEESGNELTLKDTYDHVRNGARLVMNFDTSSNSFLGYIENTTENTLENVRVEVHLSNNLELGPTNPVSLNKGERRNIQLMAPGNDFSGWTAHPEVGSGTEEGHSEEGSAEHDGREGGEHN